MFLLGFFLCCLISILPLLGVTTVTKIHELVLENCHKGYSFKSNLLTVCYSGYVMCFLYCNGFHSKASIKDSKPTFRVGLYLFHFSQQTGQRPFFVYIRGKILDQTLKTGRTVCGQFRTSHLPLLTCHLA